MSRTGATLASIRCHCSKVPSGPPCGRYGADETLSSGCRAAVYAASSWAITALYRPWITLLLSSVPLTVSCFLSPVIGGRPSADLSKRLAHAEASEQLRCVQIAFRPAAHEAQ